jgi:anti-sigma factor RsiW
MSDGSARVSDADLHAVVDGALDETRRQEVEAGLSADPALSARAAAYRQQIELLRAAFGPLAQEPPPARLYEAATRVPGRWRRWTLPAAAALVALAIGLGGGWLLDEQVLPTMRAGSQFVAEGLSAHKVYTVEVRHPVEVAASEEAHLVAWLSKRLDSPLKAPVLAGFGYRLVGGRLLPAAGRPAAQLMYENPAGERLTLYVRPNSAHQEAAFRFVQTGGASAFYWLDRDLAYAIVGEMERERLLQISQAIYDQLDAE